MLARVSKDGTVQTTPVMHGGAEGASAVRTSPTVAVGSNGVGLVCWRLASPERVSCQRFSTVDGAAIDTVIPMTSDRAVAAPSAAWLPVGGAVVAWAAVGVDNEGTDLTVQYQRVAEDGALSSPRVQGNRFRPEDQTAPAIAVGTGTSSPMILAIQSQGQDIDGWGVFIRALDFLLYP